MGLNAEALQVVNEDVEQREYMEWFRSLKDSEPDLFQLVAGLTRGLFAKIEQLETENDHLSRDILAITEKRFQ